MPDFDHAGDVIVFAQDESGISVAPAAFSFNEKFAGTDIYSRYRWPDCDINAGCNFRQNDPWGFA